MWGLTEHVQRSVNADVQALPDAKKQNRCLEICSRGNARGKLLTEAQAAFTTGVRDKAPEPQRRRLAFAPCHSKRPRQFHHSVKKVINKEKTVSRENWELRPTRDNPTVRQKISMRNLLQTPRLLGPPVVVHEVATTGIAQS